MLPDFVAGLMHSNVFAQYGLLGLFVNALFSSVIPIPTEVTTSALILSGESLVLIYAALGIGSIIGGFMIYYIGYGGDNLFHKIFKKVLGKSHKKHMDRSHSMLERYGWAIIFVSPWIPFLSDIIPLIAGAKKYDVKKFAVAMSVGKAVKVAAIVFLGSWILPLIFH